MCVFVQEKHVDGSFSEMLRNIFPKYFHFIIIFIFFRLFGQCNRHNSQPRQLNKEKLAAIGYLFTPGETSQKKVQILFKQ